MARDDGFGVHRELLQGAAAQHRDDRAHDTRGVPWTETSHVACPFDHGGLPGAGDIPPIAAAITTCALLMRVKVKPGAFSLTILFIFFVVIVAGVLSGLAVLGLIALVAGLEPAPQAVTIALAAPVLIYAGFEAIARFARGYVAGRESLRPAHPASDITAFFQSDRIGDRESASTPFSFSFREAQKASATKCRYLANSKSPKFL